MKLMLQDLSGGPSLELMHSTDLEHPNWAPDGSELLLCATAEEQSRQECLLSRAWEEPFDGWLGSLTRVGYPAERGGLLRTQPRWGRRPGGHWPPEYAKLYPHQPINGCTA